MSTDLVLHKQNASIYYLVRYTLSRLENDGEKEQATRKSAAAAVLRRLDTQEHGEEDVNTDGRSRRSRKEDLVLNQYEQMVAMDVVAPEDIPVTFEGTSSFKMHENNG